MVGGGEPGGEEGGAVEAGGQGQRSGPVNGNPVGAQQVLPRVHLLVVEVAQHGGGAGYGSPPGSAARALDFGPRANLVWEGSGWSGPVMARTEEGGGVRARPCGPAGGAARR